VQLIGRKSHQIARLGVGRTFQTASVFSELSVLQNLDIAAGAKRSALALLGVRRGIPDIIQQALETVALTGQRDKPAGVLSHGQKQWLEIGMLLVQNARVLLLDEPVAGMNAEETDRMAAAILEIRSALGISVVLVEHDMGMVMALADRVTVLDFGRRIADGTPREVQADPEVIRAYLGSGDEINPADAAEAGAIAHHHSENPGTHS